MNNVKIIGPKERGKYPFYINTTTSSTEFWSKLLSPMLVSAKPYAKNLENLWQFSKVYPEHVNNNNDPTEEFFAWQKKGFQDTWAHRYPKGKGVKPLYTYWQGEKLDYITARKQLYIPEYAINVEETKSFRQLQALHLKSDIILFDYDGYDHDALGMSLQDVVNDPTRKMGHAFVLKMILTGVY